jgi:hypothetical protein
MMTMGTLESAAAAEPKSTRIISARTAKSLTPGAEVYCALEFIGEFSLERA